MPENQHHTFSSPEDTQAFAASFAGETPQGSVLALIGDLGSGKTTFTQGFAKALGITASVGSPTFKLVSEYDFESGKLYHVDCYRLEGPDDFLNIDGESLLNNEHGVTLVEWADIILPVLPEETVFLHFSHGQEGQNVRELTIKTSK